MGNPSRTPSILRALIRSGLLLSTLLVLLTSTAQARTRVAIGEISGRGGGVRAIGKVQKALKRYDGIAIHSTKSFKRTAKRMGIDDIIPRDGQALSDVCAALEIDAVVYGRVVRKSRRSRAKVVRVDVYDRRGQLIGSHEINAGRRKRIARSVWSKVAAAIEPDLRTLESAVVGPVVGPEPDPLPPVTRPDPRPISPEPERVGRRPRVRDTEIDDLDEGGERGEIFRASAGLFFLSRTFEYTVTGASVPFAEGGIDYTTSLAPGVAIDAELFPLRAALKNAAAHIGLGLTYEKAFLSTEQEVTDIQGRTRNQSLNTAHHHIRARLQYRAPLGDGPTAIQLGGHLGLGWLKFELQDNPEYRGMAASYFDLGLDTLIPLGTPAAALRLGARFIPSADLGDTTEELGGEVSTTGFGITGGVRAKPVGDLTADLLVDYTGLSHDISGEGRGQRAGDTASDGYLGVRLLMGYAF